MVVLFASCGNNFKYFGNNYPEITFAKKYFRKADIEKYYGGHRKIIL